MSESLTKQTTTIYDLNVDQLEEVLTTNQLPEGCTLQGIELDKDFDKLFKHRLNPKYIAQHLLRGRVKERLPLEPNEMKQSRMELKREELRLKELKLKNSGWTTEQIYKRCSAIEESQIMIMRSLSNIVESIQQLQQSVQALISK